MNPTQLICDIGELNHLFKNSMSIEHFLQQTVAMVSKHLHCNVCSIYIYDEDEKMLTLKATKGLNPKAADTVQLPLGQGLVGKALKELRTLNIEDAGKHPDFKAFAGIEEEKYQNFLAIPIARGHNRIGVLSLQRTSEQKFTAEQEVACKAVASQLANIIENAKFLISIHSQTQPKRDDKDEEKIENLKASIASKGFAQAPAVVIDKDKTFKNLLNRSFDKKYNIDDFRKAIKQTENQLEELQKRVEEKLSDAASLIFASHLLILKDKEFIGAMAKMIEAGTQPPKAVLNIAKKYIDIFAATSNQYVREKIQDVEDLSVRIIGNLESSLEEITPVKHKIVIAQDLFPSDLLKFSSEEIAGIILVSGGVTSHLSILARSLGIPMLIATEQKLLGIAQNTIVLLDADDGSIYINPSDQIKAQYKTHSSARQILDIQKHTVRAETFTKDKKKITLFANVNLYTDAKLAFEMKCEGVGLYRTEFPFIIRNDFPSEQEQYVTYRRLVELMPGKPLIFRTLDIGGDKVLSYYQNTKEQNPFLGMRSIRFCLQNKEVFTQQLRAMLRAGRDADLRIMFPMISSLDEFLEARNILNDCIGQLKNSKMQFNPSPQIGMMVELPAVVDLIDDFAKEADFFSIGTNDFIQFMLGVDRTNENVAPFYLPHHPAILRAISKVATAANKHNKNISICGDMAHYRRYIPALIGMGITTFSLDPAYMPTIQDYIEKIDSEQARQMAGKLLAANRVSQTKQIIESGI